jgi:DNA-binding NarL/FixJ family response regulator
VIDRFEMSPDSIADDAMSTRKRVLIIDDYLPLREACAALLTREYEVVGLANGVENLASILHSLRPEVVVLDISLPGKSGFEVGTLLKRDRPSVRLVFFTADESPDTAVEAFERGASAYVVKHGACSELSIAIRCALMNRPYVSRRIHRQVFEKLMERQIFLPELLTPGVNPFSRLRSDTDA